MAKHKNHKSNNMTLNEKRTEKKAAVLGTQNKRKLPIGIIAAILIVIGGGTLAYTIIGGKSMAPHNAAATVASVAGAVAYPAAWFDDGKARHFKYNAGSTTIRYFILKSSDGVIRAAFDACDVCWPANKGYFQEGDKMVCRNCGRRFASVLVNVVSGGCNPAPLPRSLQGDQLVIKIDDILTGRQYFDFKGKA